MSLHIQIQSFEGPLPLLLYLIKCEDMDIFDINIHEITKQYLDYIRAMKQLDIEVAGDFISMASSLVYIKSRMLLPQYNEDGEEVEVEDPRQELAKKLWEYQRFQQAAEMIYARHLVGRDVLLRGAKMTIKPPPEADEDIVLEEDNALFALISSYRQALKKKKSGIHRVFSEFQSVGERILEMRGLMIVGQQIGFSQLIDKSKGVDQVLLTFLSLMELAKMGLVSLFQSTNFEEIYIQTRHAIDSNVIERVESYDAPALLEDLTEGRFETIEINKSEVLHPKEGRHRTEEHPATDEEIAQEESLLNLKNNDLV